MFVQTLVKQNIEDGRKLVEALEKRIPITAAFWTFDEYKSRFILMIVSPMVGQGRGGEAIGMVRELLAESEIAIEFEDVTALSEASNYYKTMRKRTAQRDPETDEILGYRTGPVSDSYVYIMN